MCLQLRSLPALARSYNVDVQDSWWHIAKMAAPEVQQILGVVDQAPEDHDEPPEDTGADEVAAEEGEDLEEQVHTEELADGTATSRSLSTSGEVAFPQAWQNILGHFAVDVGQPGSCKVGDYT